MICYFILGFLFVIFFLNYEDDIEISDFPWLIFLIYLWPLQLMVVLGEIAKKYMEK